MPALKHLWLNNIRLNNKSLDDLKSMPALERFDFDAGMLTTEEIAWIVAKYPDLFSAGLFYQLLSAMKRTGGSSAYENWNKNIPILLLSGQDDPVGDFGKGVVI